MTNQLMIATNVSKVILPKGNKPGKIEITFDYPSYLDSIKPTVEKFLRDLLETQFALTTMGMNHSVKIKGLSLTWSE